jgi:hypothetical protein
VRAYLLGQLDASDADLLEEQYFCDRASLLHVQRVEDALIRDYLRGNLSSADRLAFEARYLSSPEMSLRVNKLRDELVKPRRGIWVPISVGAIAAFFWLLSLLPPAPVELTIAPGLTMGSSASASRLVLPSAPTSVRLRLELPGVTASQLFAARISLIQADGTWKQVWVSLDRVRSSPARTGQEVIFVLNSGLLGREDYVIEVMDAEGQVVESFTFGARR